MSLDEFGFGGGWDEEEERKRRERERLGIAGAPLAPPASLPTHGGPSAWRGAARKVKVDFAVEPGRYFDEQVQKVQKVQRRRDQQMSTPMEDYYSLANRYGGQQNLSERIKRVSDLWDSYMSPYPGQQTVWDLIRSPYTEEQISGMLKTAQTVGFNYAGVGKLGLMVPSSYVREQGLDPKDKRQASIAAVRWSMGGRISPLASPGGPVEWNKIWAGFKFMANIFKFTNPVFAGELIGGAIAKGATGGFKEYQGGVAGAIGAGAGRAVTSSVYEAVGGGFAERGLKELNVIRSSKPTGLEPPQIPSELHETVAGFKAYLNESATELEIKEVEKWLSEPIFDVYGNQMEPAATAEVVQDGYLSFEEQSAIDARFYGAQRARRLAFYELQENNYIGANHEYIEDPDDPVFMEGMAKAQHDFAFFAQYGRSSPRLALLMDQSGLPITKIRLGKLWNNLTAEGIVGFGFAGLKKIAETTGVVFDFPVAAFLLELRADQDQLYQDQLNQLMSYVRADMSKNDADPIEYLTMNQNPAAYADAYVKRELKDDETALALLEKRNVQLQRVAHRYGFGGDLLTIGAYLLAPATGLKQEKIENWAAQNVDLIAGTNAAAWLATAKFGGKKTQGTPRTVEGFRGSNEAYRALDVVVDHVQGNKVNAARIADLPLVEQMTEAALKGDLGTLQSTFGRKGLTPDVAQTIIDTTKTSVERITKRPVVRNALAKLEKAGFSIAEAEGMLLRGENITQSIEANLTSRGIVRETNPNATNLWKRDRTNATKGKSLTRRKGETLDQAAERFIKEWTDYVGKNDSANALSVLRMSIAEDLSQVMLGDIARGELGTGAHIVGGRDASAFMRHLENIRTGRGQIFHSLTGNLFVALRQGFETRVKALLPFASEEAIAAVKAHRIMVKDGGVVREAIPTQSQLERFISNRQRLYGDVIDLRRYSYESAAKWWTGGGKGTMMDIFPWLSEPLAPNPSFVRQSIHDTVEAIPDGRLKTYVQRFNHSWSEAPLSEVMWTDPRYAESVFNMAYAATEDVYIAKQLQNRAIMARTKPDYVSIQNSLDAYSKQNFLRNRGGRGREIAMSVDPRTGAKRGVIGVKEGASADLRWTVPETTMSAYTTHFDRGTLWARRNLDTEGIWRVADDVANFERATVAYITPVSGVLRNITVATGMKLWGKHGLTDSLRTEIELGAGTLAKYKIRESAMREILNKLPRELQDEFATSFARVENTAAHYLHDFHTDSDYHAIQIQKNPRKSANALRRIVTSDVYRAWAKGWEKGGAAKAIAEVRTYLHSNKGMAFLKEDGFIKTVREHEAGEGRIVKGQALKNLAVETFIQNHIMGRYTELEVMAPGISQALRDLANNGEVVTSSRVRKITKDNRTENPFLPVEKTGKTSGIRGAMMWWTGHVLMMANRANRRVAFTTLFVRSYNKLIKEGAAPEYAARISMTTAELATQRIHFDLARALVVEQRHRWFAWFLTKHRLYSTWLADVAIRYPGVAVAAKEVGDWIEERFSDENTLPWNRGKINFEWKGRAAHFNLATEMWLQDFGQESDIGQLVKEGAAIAVNLIPGVNVTPRKSPFGYTGVPRIVPLLWAINHSRKLNSIFEDSRFTTPEEQETQVHEYLDSLGSAERDRWSKAITLEQAYAINTGDGPISFVEAVRRATAKNMAHTLWQQGAPVSMSIEGIKENAFNKSMQKLYEEQDPVKRNQMLREDPALIYGLNLTRDPAEALQINEGRREYMAAREEMEHAYDAAWADGSIDDPDVLKLILNNYEVRTERMLNPTDTEHYNKGYAAYIAATDQKTALEELKFIYPLADMKTIEADMFRPTGAEATAKEKELRAAFDEELKSRGWTDRDKDSLAYRRLRIEMVDEPLAEFNKEPDLLPGTNRAESWAARALARGENGLYRRDQFLDAIEDKNKLNLWMKGLSSGKPSDTELTMATLTADEKEYLGINVNAGTEARWDVIRNMTRDLSEEARRTEELNPSNKAYKQRQAQIVELAERFASEDQQFAAEYYFSKLPLHERLMYIGVGDGKTKVEEGFGEFITIVDDYYEELEITHVKRKGKETRAVGVGPEAESSFDMTQNYIKRIQALREKNDEWWRVFHRRFTLGSFGFSHMAGDKSDLDLWRSPSIPEVTEQW